MRQGNRNPPYPPPTFLGLTKQRIISQIYIYIFAKLSQASALAEISFILDFPHPPTPTKDNVVAEEAATAMSAE